MANNHIEITRLCDEWCSASAVPGGGMVVSASTEKYRLLANGVVFHELNHEELCAAVVGLSKVLLRPGLNTVVDQDHFALWSWCGELLLGSRADLFRPDQYEIKSLYEAALHASLASCRKPTKSREEWQEQNRILELQAHHGKQLLLKSHIVLAYLAFPLLEAALKRACSNYVGFDGQAIVAFTVQNKQGNPRRYDPNGSYRERQCSSLRDLLVLHQTEVAGPRLKVLLDQFRDHLGLIDTTEDPFDLLYGWRNQSLHGSTSFQTIGGAVLNLSLLISLFEIEDDFERRRETVLDHCRWEMQSQYRSPWSFYPPY